MIELDKLRQMAKTVAEREGCYLWDLELVGGSRGKGRALRVFIDKKESTVGIEDCANVSRGLDLLLDVEDSISGQYTLEVSSPGLERSLKEPWHFDFALGKLVNLKLTETIESENPDYQKILTGRRQIQGRVVGHDENQIFLDLDDKKITIPFSKLHKGKVVFEFETGMKEKPKQGKHKKKK